MIIKKIELTNWGPHKSLKVDMLANVVGVIGGNGHGKSNFLQAIDYGLNGNLNKQNKEMYIYNFGKEDGATKATVKIEFSKNGSDGVITRSITKASSTRKLEWEGRTFTSDAEVSAQMAKILGADKAAMANAIFIKQGCLGALVKGTPAERLAIFQKLMNLSFLDSRDNDLKNKIDKLKQGITDYRPAITIIATQIKDLRDEITKIKNDIPEDPSELLRLLRAVSAKLNSVQDARFIMANLRGRLTDTENKYSALLKNANISDIESIAKIVNNADEDIAKNKELKIKAEELITIRSKIGTLEAELHKATDDCLEAFSKVKPEAEIEELKTTLPRLKAHITALREKCNEERNKELLEQDIQHTIDELNAKKETLDKVTKDFFATSESLQGMIEHQSYKLGSIKLKIEYLENLGFGQGDCPICGSQLVRFEGDALKEEIKNAKEAEAAATNQLVALHKKLNTLRDTYDKSRTEVTGIEQTLDNLTGELANTKKTLEAIILDTEFPVGLREAEQLQNDYVTSLALQESNSQKAKILDNLVIRLRKEFKESLEKITRLQKEVINKDPEWFEQCIKDAAQRREKWKSELDTLTECNNARISLKYSYDNAEKRAQTLEEELEGDGSLEVLADRIEDFATDSIQELIARYEKANETFLEKTAEYSSKLSLLSQLISQRGELVEKAEVEEERLKLIDDLKTVRELTNKNGLPLAYMNSIFDKITASVQDMLSKMGANFTVFKDECRPCTFKFMRTDNNTCYTMPQEMLSGGQAIRLSLALLIACQRLILPEVGMLVLDEPSSHMDTEGVENLKDLFIQMTSIFHSSETQLIAVDHNEILETAFEKVITL